MKMTIVTGSHRKKSQSKRIAQLLANQYLSQFDTIYQHHLADMDLPYWDEEIGKGEEWKQKLGPVHSDLEESDAFVFVTPEWSGMVPSRLKNYFLLTNQKLMRHKPALIVSISSGMGGAYPVNELRTSSYKNTKICYLPEHLVLRHVESLFTGKNPELDQEVGGRVQFACDLLVVYAEALMQVRNADLNYDQYPNGM